MTNYDLLLANTPELIRDHKTFVCWKIKTLTDGKTTKIPIDPNTLIAAESDNPETWSTFDHVLDVANTHDLGVGYVFTKENGIVGIDTDDSQTSNEVLPLFNSYTEKSPSGRGYHILLMAVKKFDGYRRGKLETYDTGRFFTLTGDVVDNKKTIINEQTAYDLFGAKYFQSKPKQIQRFPATIINLNDQKILDLAFGARNGLDVENIYHGDSSKYGGDVSSGDSSLAFHLAFYTQDSNQIERLMRSSGRMREKWDTHPTYLINTINKAIDQTTEVYKPPIQFKSLNAVMETPTQETAKPYPEALNNKDKKNAVIVRGIPIEAWRSVFDYLGYTFKLNELSQDLEVNGKPITDYVETIIRSKLGEFGVFGKDLIHDAIVRLAGENQYNPVKTYLENLNPNTTAIDRLCTYFKDDSGEKEYFKFAFTKWIVGAVAKAYKSTENKTLILNGHQRLGKSFFIRWLGTAAGNHFYSETNLNPRDKDTLYYMTKTWIWEIPELGGLIGKSGSSDIKTLLTRENVVVRKSYDRYETHGISLTSFAGTVNDVSGFLNDPTGSTRFLISTLLDINHDYSKDIKVSDVWSNAYQLYKSGFNWKLDKKEQETSEIENRKYDEVDPIMEAIINLFDIDLKNESWMTPYFEVEKRIRYQGLSPNVTNLGCAMKSLGVIKKPKRIDGVQMICYLGIKAKTTIPTFN